LSQIRFYYDDPDTKLNEITTWTLLNILDEEQVTAAAVGCDGLARVLLKGKPLKQIHSSHRTLYPTYPKEVFD